jgi:DNA/RNA-binding domain of Phe-tRNA-synthetase-like protein
VPETVFRIAPEVFARIPGLSVVAVVAHGLACADPGAVARSWRAAWARVHAAYGYENAQSHPHVAAWRLAMRGIGASHKEYPTSVEALVRRALKQPEPFSVVPFVDFYNAVSLDHVVPAGAYDLESLGGDLELRETRAGDTFHALAAAAPEPLPPGEVAYATGSDVVTRHLVWRQSHRGAIVPGTQAAILLTEILPGQAALAEPVTEAYVAGARALFGATVRAALLSPSLPETSLQP